MTTESFYTESGNSPPLQYFSFPTPQQIETEDGLQIKALGYWQDVSYIGGKTIFNQAHGELNATGWEAWASIKEVN